MDSVELDGSRDQEDDGNLVVALEHVGELRRMLDELRIGFADRAHSDDLGLALLHVPEERAAADAVQARVEQERSPDSFASDLDRFLWGLRAVFAGRYAGWTPTLGKNRLVGNVEGGGGHISHNSVAARGAISPALSPWQPGPEPRGAEPGLGVRVGVLDTSISDHPWLAGGWVGPGKDRLRSASPYPALAGHGTFVAGLVLRRAPGCVVEFRRGLDDDGTAKSWAVAQRIVELGRTGLDVLNLSLGCFTEDGQPPLVLATAIDRLDPEIVVVAAAGNHGKVKEQPPSKGGGPAITADDRRRPSWPAALDDVIAVGAAQDSGIIADFTPPDVPWIDVLSNGVNVTSTFLNGEVDVALTPGKAHVRKFKGSAEWSGSSFAAALVSGAIAARTEPGSVSARRAWQAMLEERDEPAAQKLRPPGADPRFIQLLDAPRRPVAE